MRKKGRLINVMRTQKNRLIVFTVVIVLLMFSGLQLMQSKATKEVFSSWNFQYGASGDDIYELQGRLKFLGFYYGNVDGQFGYQTLKSVKYFQSEFGMAIDGIVGPKMKLKLWEATKDWAPTEGWKTSPANKGATDSNEETWTPNAHSGITANEIKLMANAVYGESRGEVYTGQVAVAAVILNRVKSSHFPNTISGVIFQPGAFTAVSDGQINLTPNQTAKKAVQDALNGWDPTGGCIYYFNPATATSQWIWSRPQVKQIGKHIFCM